MTEFFTPEALTALFQVIMIDLVLAGDNAIVIGLAAAGLPKDQRTKAIVVGIIAATVLRIGFAAATTQLLQIVGLLLAGGVLLLWVCWKMWRELRHSHAEETQGVEALTGEDIDRDGKVAGALRARRSRRLPGRSSSPTCRCRWITCWRLPVLRATTRTC
jgi:predicted tellurium resistance membrane protein TerC